MVNVMRAGTMWASALPLASGMINASPMAPTMAAPVMADVLWWRLDRAENRVDRRESVVDRQTDYGRLDVVEDWYDRVEGGADRRDAALLPRFDRHEKRTVRRLLRTN